MKPPKLLAATTRLARYLAGGPGGSYRERYRAMSPAKKEAARWQSIRRNGFFLTFADMKRTRPKR
jgi:hypothetical protein